MSTATEFELANPPDDGITALSFLGGDSEKLLASSWNGVCLLPCTALFLEDGQAGWI